MISNDNQFSFPNSEVAANSREHNMPTMENSVVGTNSELLESISGTSSATSHPKIMTKISVPGRSLTMMSNMEDPTSNPLQNVVVKPVQRPTIPNKVGMPMNMLTNLVQNAFKNTVRVNSLGNSTETPKSDVVSSTQNPFSVPNNQPKMFPVCLVRQKDKTLFVVNMDPKSAANPSNSTNVKMQAENAQKTLGISNQQKQVYHECDICHKHFGSKSALDSHKWEHKRKEKTLEKLKDDPMQCQTCHEKFATNHERNKHAEIHPVGVTIPGDTPEVCMYKCVICSENVPMKKYRRHLTRHATLHCVECDTTFCSKQYRDAHMLALHANTKQYLCDICGFQTAYRNTFTNHRKTHAGPVEKKTSVLYL